MVSRLACALLTLPLVQTAAAITEAVHYKTFFHANKGYHIVRIDINNAELTPSVHYSNRLTRFWNVAGQYQPVAAITGTFFAWENQQPVADVIIDGQQKATGYRGSILAVDWYGQIKIIDTPTHKPYDYSQYRYALRGMVRILSSGEVKPNPQAQGFRDSSIWGKAPRTAVGITPENKLLLVATRQNVTLSELGNALKSQGAVDGVSLDGGGSTLLYYMGEVKVNFGRPMSTVFMVEKRTPYDAVFQNRYNQTALKPPVVAPPLPW